MQLKSVVLPAPLGPMRPTISPGSMASEISLLASRPPKRFVAASTLSSGAMRSGRRRRRGRAAPAKPAPPRQRQQAGGPEGGDEDGGGDAAREHLVEPAVAADPLRGLLVVTDGAEVVAELGTLDEGHQREGEREEGQRAVVVPERLRRSRELQRQRGGGDA